MVLFMIGTSPCHFICGVRLLLVSMILFFLLLGISFYVLRVLGTSWERQKLTELISRCVLPNA